jgi:hypothetical protein
MPNAVLLDNVQHQDLKIIGGHGAQFGDAINEVAIFANEIADAHREYPIYFRQDGKGGFQAYALLGLDKNENLFLSDDTWQARYIPAMQDRGPFMIGFRQQETAGEPSREPVMAIDLDHPRISRDVGEPLFLPHGGNSARVERHARALRTIHTGVDASRAMFAAFQSEGLLAQIEIGIQIDESTRYTIPDVVSISQQALTELGGPALERLNKAGFLALAFLTLNSVGNVNRLIEMKNRRRAL